MDYKINYEYRSDSTSSLYFYDCDGNICTTEVVDDSKKLYSVYDCWYNACPVYKKKISDNYALLKDAEGYILYDYINGKTISTGYDNYEFINNDYIIVVKNSKEGVIDLEDNVTVELSYDKIGYLKNGFLSGYNTSAIIVKKANKYGIISFKNGNIIEDFVYDEKDIDSLLQKLES